MVEALHREGELMEIKLCIGDPDTELEHYRDAVTDNKWLDLIDGYWGDDTYHNGYREYSVAQTNTGVWLLNSCDRYEYLDDLTQDDVDDGSFLNDDQLQAIFDHGSLEAAQKVRYNRIVAAGIDLPSSYDWELAGNKLYKAMVEGGGKEIIQVEFDDDDW